MKPLYHGIIARLLGLTAFLLVTFTVPHRLAGRGANAWIDSDSGEAEALASQVEKWVAKDLSVGDYSTGSATFDGEWLFGTYMMAGMGFGQMAERANQDPEKRDHYLEQMAACIDKMLLPELRAFDSAEWRTDALNSLNQIDQHHAAYLGYMNMVLSYHRSMAPESLFVELNDRITNSLVERVQAESIMLIETYPGECYPVDNSAVMASIGLYEKATGKVFGDLSKRWEKKMRASYCDAKTGLLIQAVNFSDGSAIDEARGSGTLLASYFLAASHPVLARELFEAARRELAGSFIGFGGMREYPRSNDNGLGDIDSGPILMGFGMSATGFGIGAALAHRDHELFRSLWKTTRMCGAPRHADQGVDFVTGGPLGNAILFAMLTAEVERGGEQP